jgi:hypothetical protein
LHNAHGNKRMGTHDVVRSTCNYYFHCANASFHMGQKQLHVLPLAMLNSFCQWINIVLTKNGICTLVDVVIDVCGFVFLILHNSRICCFQYNSNPRSDLLQSTPHWSILPFGNQGIWMSSQTN